VNTATYVTFHDTVSNCPTGFAVLSSAHSTFHPANEYENSAVDAFSGVCPS
jgi:hypothetical protein